MQEYLERQAADIAALQRDERRLIPDDFDYGALSGLSNELRQKLELARPATLGQASRIDSMTPAALTQLLAHLKRCDHTGLASVPARVGLKRRDDLTVSSGI